jgi:subtilase family serine protease
MSKFLPFSTLAIAGLTLAIMSFDSVMAAEELPPTGAIAPASGQGSRFVPGSSQPMAGDAGLRMRTHVRLFVPVQQVNPESASASGYFFETPASLACLYGLTTKTTGCNPASVTARASGGSKVIAIVDAYDHPNIASDLSKFSIQFGLPAASLQVVYASGVRPPQDPTGGWELEEALDVEMAHALAPSAKIILVEAASSSLTNLLKAIDVASTQVAAAGGGEVSMSWGSDEFSSETIYDSHFNTSGVVYFAAAGDSPGVGWPAVSANVVAVGGTSVSRNPSTGNVISEATWTEGSGGPSVFVPRPSYQNAVSSLTGGTRAIPDISAVADPDTGVWVYDSFPIEGAIEGWIPVGGTSAATPIVAAIANASGTFRSSSSAQLATLYAKAGSTTLFNAITRGICGPYAGYSPNPTWSPCVGLGSAIGKSGF